MSRAGRSWQIVALFAFAILLSVISMGCDQTDEDCWVPTGEALAVTTDTLSTDHFFPKLSPDGTRVAFTTDFWGTKEYDGDGRRDLAIIDVPMPGEQRSPVARLFDLGNARRVVFASLPIDDGTNFSSFGGLQSSWPDWHPDGVRMALVVTVQIGGLKRLERLYIFEPDLAGATGQEITGLNPVLVDDVGLGGLGLENQYHYATPAFSPDGEWIAYSRFFFKAADPANGTPAVTQAPAIFAHNLLDGRTIRVTSGAPIEWEPSWSPSGTEIAFTSNRGTLTGHTEVFKVGFDPANPAVEGGPDGAVRLTFTDIDPRPKVPAGSMQPAWLGSGRIVFTSTRRPPCSSLRDRNLWSMDADGGDQKILFQTRSDDQYASVDPRGGNTIVFTTRMNLLPDFDDQKTDVWILRDFTP